MLMICFFLLRHVFKKVKVKSVRTGKNYIEHAVTMQQLPNLYISAIEKKNVRDLKV